MVLQQIIPVLVTLLALAAALYFRFHRPGAKWKLISVKGDFTAEHHLPELLPVPAGDEPRVVAGDFSLDEAIGWIQQFVGSRRRHPMLEPFRLALRKLDYYRQLSDKMGHGRWNEVDEIASHLAELDPLDPSAALARGRAKRQMGQLASAVHFYQQALKLQPTHSLALPEFAATCRAMGQPHRFDKALEIARKQLGDTHPLTIESRVQLGELVRVFADPTDPATVAHIPREQYIHNVGARLEEMDPDLDAAIPLARSMLNDDMPELAEMVLERCEQQFGERAEVGVLRGIVQHYQHELTAAERSLRGALKAEDTPLTRIELASVLLDRARQGKDVSQRLAAVREAQEHLRLAIDRSPDSVEALSLLVQGAQALQASQGLGDADGDVATAVAVIEPIARAYSRAWAPWKVLGDAYAGRERYAEALRAYEAGISRQPVDELLLPYLVMLGELKQNARLLEVAGGIKDLNERDPMLRWRVAQAYCEGRRFREARKVLQGLIEDEDALPLLRQRARDVLEQLGREDGGGRG